MNRSRVGVAPRLLTVNVTGRRLVRGYDECKATFQIDFGCSTEINSLFLLVWQQRARCHGPGMSQKVKLPRDERIFWMVRARRSGRGTLVCLTSSDIMTEVSAVETCNMINGCYCAGRKCTYKYYATRENVTGRK